jgi:hypothetical protein
VIEEIDGKRDLKLVMIEQQKAKKWEMTRNDKKR